MNRPLVDAAATLVGLVAAGEMTIGDADNDVSFDGNDAGDEGDNAYHEDGSNGTLVFNGTTVAPGSGV